MKWAFVVCLVAFSAGFWPPLVADAATKASSTEEWEYKRDPLAKSFAEDVFDRSPTDDEDAFKFYLVRNNRLYEDKMWRYGDQYNTEVVVDFGKATKVQTDERKVWDYFAAIAGPEFVAKYLKYYMTYRNDGVSTLALVWRVDEEKTEPAWALGVNVNNAKFDDRSWVRDMNTTLLHEYAHVLTLNKSQLKYKLRTSSSKIVDKKFCVGQFRSDYGCPLKNSYLKAFTDRFWTTDELTAHEKRRNLTKGRMDAVKKYYKAHTDAFVSLYAVTAPEEDIAETFVDFVITAKPVNPTTKKAQKIAFFYEFPELVKMRTDLRAKLKQYYVR